MLNAIVAINPEAVKREIEIKQIKYDHAIYGIPILIKTINVEGMPTTGTHLLRNNIAADAFIITQIKTKALSF
jgi:amidase